MGIHEQIGNLYDSTPEMIYLCTHCKYKDCVSERGCAERIKIIERLKGIEKQTISSTQYFELNGKRQMLRDWAKDYGINAQTLTARLQRGIALKEALTMKPERGRHRGMLINIDGQTYPSYTWFKMLGVSPSRVRKLTKARNITIEQALMIIIAERKSDA